MNKNLFEEKIQPILQYIGIIGASICSVAYILVVCVMIIGFEYHQTRGAILFAIVNAVVGLIVMQFLKVQGIAFAEKDPENIEISKRYYSTKTKDKKAHSMTYFWVTTAIKDILTKGLSVAITSFGLVYIVIQGSNDYNMLLLALVNLLMFVCFGLLSLNKSYRYYYDSYIPYMIERLKEIENNERNN